jgi:hypothetical protein
MMTERWVCEDCGTPFVRFAKLRAAERAVEKRVREECAKRLDKEVYEHKKIGEDDRSPHGRLFRHSAFWLEIMAKHLRADPLGEGGGVE